MSMSKLHDLVRSSDLDGCRDFLNKNPEHINWLDEYGKSALHIACYNNDENMVKLLISYPDLDVNLLTKDTSEPILGFNNDDSEAALHIACIESNDKIVDLLLSVDSIDVNVISGSSEAPLHIAVCSDHNLNIVKSLVSNKNININVLDDFLNTPLHLACLEGSKKVIKFLAKCPGVDFNLKNECMETCADCLIALSDQDIVQCVTSTKELVTSFTSMKW